MGGNNRVFSISERSMNISELSISIGFGCGLSFRLVDLAHSGDREWNIDLLERGSTGNNPLWFVGSV
jgi:hypothetical protein